ncbi:hypothetical protein [Hymenobacter sp. HDW8]|uniref:TapB family protein n=1 Tax=Hymenobacter sp. HDW8 TaxID=2714932 RepID=UPI00140BF740|nr:hypothetical protein [Hymenobacter sp. HDW8]QIL74585.1 hypothetical protein G7064_00945 [Hymenobacter sp. HDW8]
MPYSYCSLLSSCALVLAGLTAQAQDSIPTPATSSSLDCTHPFGLASYMELVYSITDDRGKPAGTIRQRVVSLGSQTNKKKTITTNTALVKSGFYDVRNRLIRMQDLTYGCRQDTTFTDGMSEIEFKNLSSFRDRRLAYTPVGLAWPNQPTVGTMLPGGGVSVQVSSTAVNIAQVNTTVRRRRIVSGPAPLVTPAGTFQCYKVESEREASTAPREDMVMRTRTRVVDYYSPAVGIVKTEVYNKNGKLAETRLLTARNAGNQP